MKINNFNELFHYYDLNIQQFIGYKIISQGHIHTTYVLYFDLGNKVKRYLLQQINTNVFENPEKVMNNISLITTHIKKQLKVLHHRQYKDKILRLYPTKEKKTYVVLSNQTFWRIYHFVENSITFNQTTNLKVFYEAGLVIGEFHHLLSNFNPQLLYPVLEDFHHSVKRFNHFKNILNKADINLIETCKDEINFIIQNQNIAYIIQDLIDQNKIPLRVTHNDTKLNNIMFEYGTYKGKCLVDLDTIMPGCICFDYGDFIRSACNYANEDEIDLNKVGFNEEGCLEFTKAFLFKTISYISEIEVKNLINGAIDMCYECGMRFLSDYLNHNTYFKISYPTHNLVRCKTQIKLCQEILKIKEKLEEKILFIYNQKGDVKKPNF